MSDALMSLAEDKMRYILATMTATILGLNWYKRSIHSSNKSINKLIRENRITVDMGSSLVNDNDTVNDFLKKLITIAELLYEKRDSLLENDKE